METDREHGPCGILAAGGGVVCGKPGLRVKDERETEAQHKAGELEVYMRQQQQSPRGQERRGKAETGSPARAEECRSPGRLLGDGLQPREEPWEKMFQDPSAWELGSLRRNWGGAGRTGQQARTESSGKGNWLGEGNRKRQDGTSPV